MTRDGHKLSWGLWLGYLLHIWAYINTEALYSVDGKCTCICHVNLEGGKKQEARNNRDFTVNQSAYKHVAKTLNHNKN